MKKTILRISLLALSINASLAMAQTVVGPGAIGETPDDMRPSALSASNPPAKASMYRVATQPR